MTTVVYENETEVGLCDFESIHARFHSLATEHATLFARTKATLNGRSRLLWIEQHCYIRHEAEALGTVELRNLVEPAPDDRDEMAAMLENLHQSYVAEARQRVPERVSDD